MDIQTGELHEMEKKQTWSARGDRHTRFYIDCALDNQGDPPPPSPIECVYVVALVHFCFNSP